MVRIFGDNKHKGNYVVQTTCLDADSFIMELSEALAMCKPNGVDSATMHFGILTQAMPVAFKLAGYKADTVSEQRTLVCGSILPADTEVVASVGK